MTIEEIINRLDYLMRKEHAKNSMLPDGFPLEKEVVENENALHEAIALLKTHPDAQPIAPLTLEELMEMDGEAVYLAADRKWYIVSLKFPGPWGNNVPCGVDMWGAGTSLSLLAKCGVYRRPPKEDKPNEV